MEEIEFIIDETKEAMNASVAHLEKSFLNRLENQHCFIA